MKKLIGVIWVVFGAGLFLYSLSGLATENERITHLLTACFGGLSALAGILTLKNHSSSRLMLWIVSVLIFIYSILALSMVGLEFGVGFLAGIILIIGLALMTIFSLLRLTRK